jgi:hypothetical protein
MLWLKLLGIDVCLLDNTESKIRKRQITILSILSAMLLIIILLVTTSAVTFLLTLFQSWWVALPIGLIFGSILFLLYQLLVITSIEGSGSFIEEYFKEHEINKKNVINLEQEVANFTDEEISQKILITGQALREKRNISSIQAHNKGYANIVAMTLRVFLISLIALITASGIEILIFHNGINQVLNDMKVLYQNAGDRWFVDHMLTPSMGKKFCIVETNSLLLVLNILETGIGYWKIVIDILVLTLFILPLVLTFRCTELKLGVYMKEYAISSVCMTYFHWMTTKRYCKELKKNINNQEIFYTFQ